MSTSAEQAILDQLKVIRASRESVTGEQKWMQTHITELNLRRMLPDISIVGFHLMSALETEPQTGIELAQKLSVTRGGITRAAKKLVAQGLLSTFQRPDDRKKIFYRLTPSGRKLAQYHDQVHVTFNKRALDHLKTNYSPEELVIINRFLVNLGNFEQQLP